MSHTRFVHLDDYQSPIITEIARPLLMTQRKDGVKSLTLPQIERWPPVSVPLSNWGGASRFGEHCLWMCTHVPIPYITKYWALCHRLPALGHLHFLYNHAGVCSSSIRVLQQDVALVDLPADLCVCDCVLAEDETVPFLSTSTATVEKELPVLSLLSHCIQVSFHWVLFSATDVTRRLDAVSEEMVRVMIFIHCCADCDLPVGMQEEYSSRMRDPTCHMPFLVSIVESHGVNRDIDPFVLQAAFLLTTQPCTLDPVVVVLWKAIITQTGPLARFIHGVAKFARHGDVPLEVQLLLNACGPVSADPQLTVFGASGSPPPSLRRGVWLVLSPDHHWDESQCVMQIWRSQAALFEYA